MEKIEFEDGELVQSGYVMIDGTKHEITEAVYNGTIPLSAYWLNKLQENVENAIAEVSTTIGNIATILDSINGEAI